MPTTLDQLAAAIAARELVRIERKGFDISDRLTVGVPLAVSDTLVLVALLSDRIDFDGFDVLRLADVTACATTFERKEFYAKALEPKGLVPVAPELNLTSIQGLLASAQEQFPLLTIHRELLRPGECDIGRVKLGSDSAFAIHYIDPSARWRDEPGHYRYADVTRVSFGGAYEATLASVGGPLSN